MAEFTITRRNGDRYTVLVDDEDLEVVQAAGPWCVMPCGSQTYVGHIRKTAGTGRSVTTHLHRWLKGPPEGVFVCHLNGNGLDNRRGNLSLVTRSHHRANARQRSDNTSGFKGVTATRSGTWQAMLTHLGVVHRLGTFKTPEEAHAAYVTAACGVWGDFANPG